MSWSASWRALNRPGQAGGNGTLRRPTAEPAPIDETNEITPPVDPNVKAQAEAEVKATRSELPLMYTDPVAAYINIFPPHEDTTFCKALWSAAAAIGK